MEMTVFNNSSHYRSMQLLESHSQFSCNLQNVYDYIEYIKQIEFLNASLRYYWEAIGYLRLNLFLSPIMPNVNKNDINLLFATSKMRNSNV